MTGAYKTRTTTKAAWWLLAALLVYAPFIFAVEPVVPSNVDIYWKSTRTIAAPGVTSVIVLDDEIAHAQIGNDTIEFVGLSRGETVALAYVNGSPVSIVVRVVEHPFRTVPPSLLRREAELAHGIFGSDFQLSSAGGTSQFVALNSAAWSQQIGDHRVEVHSQVEDNTQFGGHTMNLRTGGVSYITPHVAINILDFSQSLSGALPEDHVNNFTSPSIMELRGAGVTLDRGKNEFSFFAGSTIPYYFLSLNATRDIAGFSFHRKQTDKLNLFGSTEYANIPINLTDGFHRRGYVMQNAGLSYRLGKGFLLGAQGGISNHGGLLRGDASYSSFRLSGYGTVILSSQTFPLNQLQSLLSGTSSIKGAVSYRTSQRLTQGLYFEHTNISPGLIYRVGGSTDYVSPNLSFHISRGESLSTTYTYSRSTGGFSAATTTGSRYDLSLNSQLTDRIGNSAQVTLGAVQDPLQINSEQQLSIRDSISLPIKGQILLLGIEHDRVQPSLVTKLNQELNLLSPVLLAEFQANPAAFVDSTNFPPEIKALLAAEQPTGTTISASTSLAIGSRLRLSPNVSVTHSANGASANAWTQAFGYSASYQLRPTLQLRSSLNNVLLWNSQQAFAQRTTVLTAGFQKSFSATPGALPFLHHSRIIEGRVFRDNNINGAFNLGEPGIPDVEVRLDDGQVVVTDAQGRYRFSSVSADQHTVSINTTQFRNPVRMTTRSEIEADMIQQHIVVENFGILDFARVMGYVYNDLVFENRRQPDSKGMQGIDLLLDNGKEIRKIQTTGSGDFELDNVPPGDYKLSLDAASIPSNYAAPIDSVAIHVSPVSTVVQDLPMRALRSISGRILLKVQRGASSISTKIGAEKPASGRPRPTDKTSNMEEGQEFELQPVVGVQIVAGPSTAITDAEGNFLLRNLPAGNLRVTIQPVRPVPDGIKIPSGEVKLPAEPVQIQGATIIITNADLLPYLTREFPAAPGQIEQQKVVAEKVVPKEMEREGTVVKSGVPAKPVQTDTQPAAVRTLSRAPAVPEIVPPVQIHPTVSLAQVPAASPNPPVAAPIARTVPTEPTPRAVGDTSAVRDACQSVTSLADAAQCMKQKKRNAAMGTLQ